ncbi:MAG: hypothetical protein KJ732_07415 [Candidatus Margulisbacteria bacterium]|nr:hypothetical protein [Candidatus Margulisiibacteriota bacterium]
MKKIVLSLVLVTLVSGLCFATELTGKWGIGAREGTFAVRRFFNNGFAGDIYLDYSSATMTGASDSNGASLGVAGVFVREIADKTLLEFGATVGGYSGIDSTGAAYTGLHVNPFVGGEYLMGDNFGFDFKIIIASYFSEMSGATRTTGFVGLASSWGAHLYF